MVYRRPARDGIHCMTLLDLLLNLAGLLLWLNWLAVRFDPLARPQAATLMGTLHRAEPSRLRRALFLGGLIAVLGVRALFYWQIGAGVDWTPRLPLGAVTLSFPLGWQAEFLGLMLIFSVLSFLITLAAFYLWLVLLSLLGTGEASDDPFLRLARACVGRVGHWPWGVRLVLPWLGGGAAWLTLLPLLTALQLVPPPVSSVHRLEQAVLLGLSAYLMWKPLVVGLLLLHLLNSYVYLGTHPFWGFVSVAGRSLLRPLARLPLRTRRLDFAPVVAIALVLLICRLAQQGLRLPGAGWTLPGLADLYMRLPL